MFPEEFINRIHTQKYIDPGDLLKALEEPSPVSIRINARKWGKKPADSESVPWCNNGYYLQRRPSYTLDPLFHSGCYYPQEASSMFLEQVIRQTSGLQNDSRVLDLCAAPGGKSTHISDIIGPGSLLVANETIRARAAILAETISKWGAGNTLVTQNDPSAFGKLEGYFDLIIADAPCSGEGMFRNEIAFGEWSSGNTVHCSERQKRILMDVWPALKENGILVYSTCTFNPGENEENVRWLTGKQEAITIRIDVSEFKGIKEIFFDGIYGYGFYPGKVKGEGFFISVIRKTGKQHKTQVKSQIRKELHPGKNDLETAYKWTHFQKERLFKWRDELFAVPCSMDDYLFLYSHLKIVKAGTKVFVVKNNDYLPAHEFVLSTMLKKHAFPTSEIDLSGALAFMKRDKFKLQNAPMGWNIVTYKGVNLGFVNNIGKRVNNYFPVEWRIRMDLPETGKENIILWE
jgi:16S rRNA C967 or C1407 C5-methylase (RsmB/RsmF family)/NOL1/NOP2/fmu family ribosome biogenesis protein